MDARKREVCAEGVIGVSAAQELSGLSRAGLYRLMSSRQLAFTKVGRRRLIVRQSLIDLLAQGLVEAVAK